MVINRASSPYFKAFAKLFVCLGITKILPISDNLVTNINSLYNKDRTLYFIYEGQMED